jgi:hypothetical protein
MEKFFGVMEGPVGRWLRIALGMVLIYIGLARIGGMGGGVLAIAGLLPILMGLSGPCLVRLVIRSFKRA